MHPSELSNWLIDPRRRVVVMGVLNVTPDSFSDGGKFISPAAALAHAEAMAADGADWIDVGAESTRPGSQRITADQQSERLGPILAELRRRVPLVLSIDTTRASVAARALDAGFDIINDISAGQDDPAMLSLAAERGASMILMHMQGQPVTMQAQPHYQDVTAEVREFLIARVDAAEHAGIRRERLLIDPGIGFGKTAEHNLRLLHDLPELAGINVPLVIGTSRKKFIGKVIASTVPAALTSGTLATVAWAALHGAAAVRVHDVAPTVHLLRMMRAIGTAAS